MSVPLISVVVPTFNRAELLPRALDSVVAQTLTDWEIIVVDDGSGDDTPAVARRYAESLPGRFHFIHQENAGSSAARNRGIEAARGRFIAFLDSDDAFLPRKLERQAALFERCPELGLVYCDSEYVSLDGNRHRSVLTDKAPQAREVVHRRVAPGLFQCVGDVFDVLLRGYFISTICGMVRRAALGDSIRFPVGLRYAEEWLFYLRVTRRHAVGYVDEPLCVHYFVNGSLSRTSAVTNSLNAIELFRALQRELPSLTRDQRRVVRTHLAAAHQQAGYDAFRSGDFAAARHHFGCALVERPTWSCIRDIVHAWLRLRAPNAPSASRSALPEPNRQGQAPALPPL